jgi:carbon-monoxide dehydrogenase small subunit/xanthine dehydrogenase small subunit
MMTFTFMVNGRAHQVTTSPLRRLLDILREDLDLTGTKEGCGEGECGACSVLLDGKLVNACLVPALQLPGRHVITIEGLGTRITPDPVQQAFMDEGSAQCGFCIPAMVLASRALLDETPEPTPDDVRRALAGNICRCTGYERIFRAVEKAAAWERSGEKRSRAREMMAVAAETTTAVASTDSCPTVASTDSCPAVYSPSTLAEALDIRYQHGDQLLIIAGGTDLLVEMKLGRPAPPAVMDLGRVDELRAIEVDDDELRIGATATFAELGAVPIVREHYPALAAMAAEIGAAAIQNRATIGGNLITASPAADAPPVLMALGASVALASRERWRTLALHDFFADYRRTVLEPGELLMEVCIPLPAPEAWQAFYKVGTRRAQAISKVCLGASGRLDGERRIADLTLAAGSVAPTPIMLDGVSDRLVGRRLTPETRDAVLGEAARMTSDAVAPIDDVRSTASYRADTLGRLVARFLGELIEVS